MYVGYLFLSYQSLAFQGRTCLVELVCYSNANWTLPVQFCDTNITSEFFETQEMASYN
jgi:hypothetical protein